MPPLGDSSNIRQNRDTKESDIYCIHDSGDTDIDSNNILVIN